MAVVAAVPDEPTVEALVGAAVAGDLRAEGSLCYRFAPAVRTYWRRRLKGADAVDEATQEVFLRFVQAVRAGQVSDHARVGGFLLGICKNVARERARQQERRQELWDQFGSALAALEDEPQLARYQLAQLEDCLSQLTVRTRDVIKGAFIEGHTAADIASKLAMTEGNVRVVRHRALESLRECMSQKIFWDQAAS
jgi:RNA polymerase sigma-70 factor, ECF subfamily